MKVQRPITFVVALVLVALGAAACGGGNSTPTKAFQTFYNAMKNKDTKSLRSVMPKQQAEKIDEAAKAQNKSFDDMMKPMMEAASTKLSNKPMPETRNEKISDDGKTATLEVKDPESDKWGTLPFIKEDDGWKLGKATF